MLQKEGVNHVKTVSLHPGVVNTQFIDTVWTPMFKCLLYILCGVPLLIAKSVCFKTPKDRSKTAQDVLRLPDAAPRSQTKLQSRGPSKPPSTSNQGAGGRGARLQIRPLPFGLGCVRSRGARFFVILLVK